MAKWNVEVPSTEYYGPLPFNPRGVTTRDLGPLIRELEDSHTIEIAIDTETTGLVIFKEQVLYWSLAWGNRRCCLHASVLPYFKHIFEDPTKIWIFANAKFDMHMLANMGIRILGKIYCTQVMHSLLFEEMSHRLKDMAKHLLGWRWSDFQDTFGKINVNNTPLQLMQKAEAENFPLLCEYASNDAWGTIGVYRDLKPRLQNALTHSLFREIPPYIETLWDLFTKVESPYTRVLWKMERNGILIDTEYLASIQPRALKEIEQLEQDVCRYVGWMINIGSTPDLRRYFFDQRKYSPLKMTSGGKSGVRQASVDADFLQHAADEIGDPVAKMVLEHRNLTKLYGTYIQGIYHLVDAYGRIHSKFNQDVTRCMPAGELVLTNRGYLPVEQVVVGDKVISHRGVPRSVTGTSVHAPKTIYRVQLKNGLVLRTTGNHQYRAVGDGWLRADELELGQEIVIHSNPERWKTIRGWSDFKVSTWGRVHNVRTGHILTQYPKGRWGHLKVCLYRNGAQKRGKDRKDFAVHRLVLKTFGGSSANETRHLNGIAWDNTLFNLTYGTPSENRQDAVHHGTMSQRRAGRTILTESDVAAILRAGSPGQPPSTTSKLNYGKAEEIRAKYPAMSRQRLADEYGVSYVAVDNIIKGKTWKRSPTTQRTAEEWAEIYGVSAGTIRNIWAGRRWTTEDGISGAKATFSSSAVESVTVEGNEVTYGLTVEEDCSHVTGGIVTHNTGRLSCVAEWTPITVKTRVIGNSLRQSLDVPIKYVDTDDWVWTHEGRFRRVLKKVTKGLGHMFDVHLSNGNVLTCTADHRLLDSNGQWIPVGDLIDEYLERVGVTTEEPAEGPGPLQKLGLDDDRADCGEAQDNVSQRLSRDSHAHAGEGAKDSSKASLLGVEDGEQEPHERKYGQGTPQLEGRVRRWKRLLDRHTERKAAVRPSSSDGTGTGSGRAPGGDGGSPHRRQSEEQQPGQPGIGHKGRAQDHSLFAGRGLPPIEVTEVYYRGSLEVHDITVEEDESYLACGVLSHNSTDPNLQNIPNVEKDKWRMRAAFIAPPKHKLLVHDYNQLEMRLLAAAAREKDMIDIFLRNWDIHMGNASMMMGIPYDELKLAKKIDKEVKEGDRPAQELTARVLFCLHARAAAKNIGFGLNYGMGAAKLANDLGISLQEAVEKIALYKKTYPAVTKFYEEAVNIARQTGYSFTILGRRRNLPGIASSRRDERARAERQAINVEIQGTAADVMKMAQINLDKANLEYRFGCYSLVNIHDELIHQCPDETVEPAQKEIAEWMECPFYLDLDVPLTVASGKAQNWQDAK